MIEYNLMMMITCNLMNKQVRTYISMLLVSLAPDVSPMLGVLQFKLRKRSLIRSLNCKTPSIGLTSGARLVTGLFQPVAVT